jgi:hypothetical protein
LSSLPTAPHAASGDQTSSACCWPASLTLYWPRCGEWACQAPNWPVLRLAPSAPSSRRFMPSSGATPGASVLSVQCLS